MGPGAHVLRVLQQCAPGEHCILKIPSLELTTIIVIVQLAFDHVGSMPMSKIQEFRAEKQEFMSADLRQRQSKKNLQRAIKRGSSLNEHSGEGALPGGRSIRDTSRVPALPLCTCCLA